MVIAIIVAALLALLLAALVASCPLARALMLSFGSFADNSRGDPKPLMYRVAPFTIRCR